MSDIKDLRTLYRDELLELVQSMGEKAFRGKQIYEWLHKKQAMGFEEMTNIPKALKEKLGTEYFISSVTPVDVLKSKLDGTEKFLFRLHDGNVIESVLMRYEHGNSVCISSQVGCRMGCSFCASTIGGRIRDLTAGEMLAQIYFIQNYDKQRVSNVVVMGTGEPFDNFDNFVRFYKILTDEEGMNLSGRNVTVSTCGLVDKIRELADMELPLTLAISLHAPNDERRKKLMPVANRFTIAELLSATDYYFEKTGRRITYEYSLIAGENDTEECAEQLVRLMRPRAGKSHVNLIPVNPVKERSYKRSDASYVMAFKNYLEKHHINATVRRELGADINGACGQLRRSFIEENETKLPL